RVDQSGEIRVRELLLGEEGEQRRVGAAEPEEDRFLIDLDLGDQGDVHSLAEVVVEAAALDHISIERQDALLTDERPLLAQTGITPCFFHGRSTRLFRAMRRPRMIVGRVSRGSMMSSIIALPAAM